MREKQAKSAEKKETVFVGAHLPVSLHRQLQAAAEADRRPLAHMIRVLLEESVEGKLAQLSAMGK